VLTNWRRCRGTQTLVATISVSFYFDYDLPAGDYLKRLPWFAGKLGVSIEDHLVDFLGWWMILVWNMRMW
jgi:hypothetical protein